MPVTCAYCHAVFETLTDAGVHLVLEHMNMEVEEE